MASPSRKEKSAMDSLLQTFGEIIDRGAEDMNAAELMESERKFDDAVDRAVAEA
jgi:hypothetical protein